MMCLERIPISVQCWARIPHNRIHTEHEGKQAYVLPSLSSWRAASRAEAVADEWIKSSLRRRSRIRPYAETKSDCYPAVCSRSLSAERDSLGIGMLTITDVPERFDSIFISPWN